MYLTLTYHSSTPVLCSVVGLIRKCSCHMDSMYIYTGFMNLSTRMLSVFSGLHVNIHRFHEPELTDVVSI